MERDESTTTPDTDQQQVEKEKEKTPELTDKEAEKISGGRAGGDDDDLEELQVER